MQKETDTYQTKKKLHNRARTFHVTVNPVALRSKTEPTIPIYGSKSLKSYGAYKSMTNFTTDKQETGPAVIIALY